MEGIFGEFRGLAAVSSSVACVLQIFNAIDAQVVHYAAVVVL